MTASRRHRRRWLIAAAVLAAAGGLLLTPVTTRQGVNFTVSVHHVPLSLKALSFLDRHYQHRHLAHQITRGMSADRERVLALFAWTRQHIQPTPPQLPVVDDHVWHIIVRGYGQADQMADVFTTLATYAGLPAFWTQVELPDRGEGVIFSYARVEGRWTLFDVARGLVFTDVNGQFLDVVELLQTPERIQAIAGDLSPYGIPYRRFVESLAPFEVPWILRARKQMPWPRLWYEVRYSLVRWWRQGEEVERIRQVALRPVTAPEGVQ